MEMVVEVVEDSEEADADSEEADEVEDEALEENANHLIVMVETAEIVEDSEKRENVHLIEIKLVTLENAMNVDFQKEMFHLANLVSIVVIKIKNPENISGFFICLISGFFPSPFSKRAF